VPKIGDIVQKYSLLFDAIIPLHLTANVPESNSTTQSAEARLMPMPPARVLIR
jgi:hypothetical protein